MYIIVLIVIIALAFLINFVNKCYNKPYKQNGKCVTKCDNYIAEDGVTCLDSCPNFIDEENKTCVAKCPSYKPYAQSDKYCSPYNILDTQSNIFNLKRYSNDNFTVLFNDMNCSDDTKVIAINRLYGNDEIISQDYFISKDFGNTFNKYTIDFNEDFVTIIKVSSSGECIAVVSNFNIKVYHKDKTYIHKLDNNKEMVDYTEYVADYKIIDDKTHFYLYNLTKVDNNLDQNQNIIIKHGIKISTDYGKTFQNLYENTVNDIDFLNTKLCVSKDKKQLFYTVENTINNTSTVFTSSDYGKTFTSYDIKGIVDSANINESGSCKVLTSHTLLEGIPNKGYIYNSNDYGKTWNEILVSEEITKIESISMTERGQNQLFLFEKGDSKNGILMSRDYGKTYKILIEENEDLITGASMTLDSKFITVCTSTKIRTSSDYGETFKQNENMYSNLGSSNVSSQVYISSSPFNYLNGKINIILSSSNSLFYTTLLSLS